MYNFRSESNKCPTIFSKFIFSHFNPEVRQFFAEKGKPKIFGFKNVMEKQFRKNSHFRNTLNCIWYFRDNKTNTLVISKRFKFPLDGRTDTNFITPLNIHFYGSNSTRDSLKSVFNAFRRKPLLGAPVGFQRTLLARIWGRHWHSYNYVMVLNNLANNDFQTIFQPLVEFWVRCKFKIILLFINAPDIASPTQAHKPLLRV